jgi:ribosome-binding factor A
MTRRARTARSGRTPSQRQLRVGEELRHTLARLLMRGELRDPDLTDVPITVTEVRIGPDLHNATVFVTPLGGANAAAVVAALNRAAPWLRGQVGREVRLRHTPALEFTLDSSFDQAATIGRALADPVVARDVASEGDDGTPDDGTRDGGT